MRRSKLPKKYSISKTGITTPANCRIGGACGQSLACQESGSICRRPAQHRLIVACRPVTISKNHIFKVWLYTANMRRQNTLNSDHYIRKMCNTLHGCRQGVGRVPECRRGRPSSGAGRIGDAGRRHADGGQACGDARHDRGYRRRSPGSETGCKCAGLIVGDDLPGAVFADFVERGMGWLDPPEDARGVINVVAAGACRSVVCGGAPV